jgi:hypothetical protein
MRFVFISIAILVFSIQAGFCQCPVITNAMVNSCGTTEGINEFVVFTTTASDVAGAYQLNYGSNNPPSVSSTGIMPGANASAKTGAGSITGASCTIHEVTGPTTIIPANSKVIFIPASFDQQYDVTGLCNGQDIYVVYINTTAPPAKWASNGTLANDPSGNRYLQIEYNGNACTDNISTYKYGWSSDKDGNFLSWDANGIAAYTNHGCTTITTPVKLISFIAALSGNKANVSWQAATEFNSKNFVVEKSTDGINFYSINTIPITGNSSTVKNYTISDYALAQGLNFYRLETIDIDGSTSYSQIVKVTNTGNDGNIKVYPTITTGQINIEWNTPYQGNTSIIIFDCLGRVLIKKQLSAITGANYYQLNTEQLPSGNYALKIFDSNQSGVVKFTKQ